ncbi:CehA/McbA family metallohydrolase [Promicromonospora citrea]|uniref:Phosphoesterase n=1 Tax=Promicromonospora citrea TaxID=43677 RepID=A0A8H9GJF6_9MICO|nr:CehA/McbA family metallohydrolase [Promicromonospora citrea]NNH55014.1 CehA/McbA family metallohydrolase [Promicromonospora citrea]GGM28245.1 phosphoesterase [Promicromonospora citrea]
MSRQQRRLSLSTDDQIAQRYLEVPFDVPPGTTALEVTLAFDREAAVIDLGCRDPQRWRGWSGGARSRFAITPAAATPGYEPGELVPGTWAVVLGLHVLREQPVDVTVTVATGVDAGGVEGEPPAPPPGPAVPAGGTRTGRALPAPDGLTWFAGDLHAHTTHSDGTLSIAQLTAAAAGRGLDFLAVTDHNTVSHHPHLPGVGATYDVSLLPGQEVTTHAGHANAFGDIGWVDFRRPAAHWVADVEAHGGLLSVNHPLQDDCGWHHPVRTGLLELWHISWFLDLTATGPWAYLRTVGTGTAAPVLLGGSDFHTPDQGYPPGTPTTWVAAADRTPEAILDAVRHGRTALSRFPGPGEPVLVRVGEDLVALDADGTVLVDLHADTPGGRRRRVRGDHAVLPAPPEHGPYRLEAADRTLLAISA